MQEERCWTDLWLDANGKPSDGAKHKDIDNGKLRGIVQEDGGCACGVRALLAYRPPVRELFAWQTGDGQLFSQGGHGVCRKDCKGHGTGQRLGDREGDDKGRHGV